MKLVLVINAMPSPNDELLRATDSPPILASPNLKRVIKRLRDARTNFEERHPNGFYLPRPTTSPSYEQGQYLPYNPQS